MLVDVLDGVFNHFEANVFSFTITIEPKHQDITASCFALKMLAHMRLMRELGEGDGITRVMKTSRVCPIVCTTSSVDR
jgi:hypothetical protein